MEGFLRQSTAFTFRIGPFLDSTDANSEETGLTIDDATVKLSKAGGAFAAKNDNTDPAHDANSFYSCVLNTTDTGTLGLLKVFCHPSGALMAWHTFMVIPQPVYDSLFAGSDKLQVDTQEWAGTATDATDVALATSPSNFAALAITAGGVVTATVSDKTGFSLSSAGILAIWDQLMSGITADDGSIGGWIKAKLDVVLSTRAAPGAAMDLIPDALDAGAVAPSGAAEIAAAVDSNIQVEVIFPQAVATMAAALVGGRMTITTDSDFTTDIPVPGGISATRDDSLWTAKTEDQVNTGALDNEALIQVSENGGGVLYLNGSDGEGLILPEGTLTVIDELDGDGNGLARLTLTSWLAAQLQRRTGSKFLKWDYKVIELGADLQRVKGDLDIVASVTRTISP